MSAFGSARVAATPLCTCRTGLFGHGGSPPPWLDSLLNCNVVPPVQRIGRIGRRSAVPAMRMAAEITPLWLWRSMDGRVGEQFGGHGGGSARVLRPVGHGVPVAQAGALSCLAAAGGSAGSWPGGGPGGPGAGVAARACSAGGVGCPAWGVASLAGCLDGRVAAEQEAPRVVRASLAIAAGPGPVFGLIAAPVLQPRWDGSDDLAGRPPAAGRPHR